MNYIQKNSKLWAFPETIGFESVPGYLSSFMELADYNEIIYDLSGTRTLHTSFIGFLIHTKHLAHKKNMSIKLILSPAAAKILKMLELYDLMTCSSFKAAEPGRKSA